MPRAIMLQMLSLLLASAPHPSRCSRSILRLPILKKKRKKPQPTQIQQKSDVATPITPVTEKDFRN